jgi:glycosyltransferase involved in cell wall biosynthesis
MDLIINGTAAQRSSLGARRYYEGVMRHLHWPDRVVLSPLARWPRLERLGELLDRGRPDALYWSPAHRGPLFAYRHVITVLDCLNIEYVYRDDWRLPAFRRLFNAVLDNAVAIVTISRATADAVLRNYAIDPAKLVVIAGPTKIDDGQPLEALARPAADASPADDARPFVLMITNALPHKNTVRAVEAFVKSHAGRLGIGLRVVGSLDPRASSMCEAAGIKVDERRGVDDTTLSRWLTGCLFLLAPSLDEGLDLPIAEALKHGANVVYSDIAVHREFYEGCGRSFDPLSVDSIVSSLNEALAAPGRWPVSSDCPPRASYGDVALAYRGLFLRVAAGESPQVAGSERVLA